MGREFRPPGGIGIWCPGGASYRSIADFHHVLLCAGREWTPSPRCDSPHGPLSGVLSPLPGSVICQERRPGRIRRLKGCGVFEHSPGTIARAARIAKTRASLLVSRPPGSPHAVDPGLIELEYREPPTVQRSDQSRNRRPDLQSSCRSSL